MLRFSDYADKITVSLNYHIENKIPLAENIYRVHSEEFYALFREARHMFNEGLLQCESEWDRTLLETDIGEFAKYEGMKVPLDCPIQEEDEKNPPLNKPKKGGPKKFYVFVKDGDKIKKVTWGDTTGLRVKLNDKEARKNFAARHNCASKTDKTTPGYWACNLPRYAKSLGLTGGGNFYW
jgi:hypothetical protein|tara:strand:+ start:2434 stop:2973 length:540 start_codon:yes stop_codon:yes gene_type:complete